MHQGEAVSTGAFEVHTERDVMAPMHDGVRLAADIHRPARGSRTQEGPFPVLLHRTPYNKSTEARVLEAGFFTARGYVAVIQNCRGAVRFRGWVHQVRGRGCRRLGHAGMAGPAALVQREDRHLRPLLFRPYSGRPGLPEPD